jgi:hypothetical protein
MKKPTQEQLAELVQLRANFDAARSAFKTKPGEATAAASKTAWDTLTARTIEINGPMKKDSPLRITIGLRKARQAAEQRLREKNVR